MLVCFLSTTGYAQHNQELQQMANDDLASRNVADIDWEKLNKEDSLRRIRVQELYFSMVTILSLLHWRLKVLKRLYSSTIH